MMDARDICLKKVYHLGCDFLTARKVAEHLERLVAEEAERRTTSGALTSTQAQALVDECTVVQIDGPFGRFGGYDFCMCFLTLKSNTYGQIALDRLNGVRSYGHNWSAVWGKNSPGIIREDIMTPKRSILSTTDRTTGDATRDIAICAPHRH